MKNKMRLIIVLMFTLILLISCGKPQAGKQITRKVKEDEILIMVQEMQQRDLDKFIKVTGKLEGITDVNLMSETNGKVVEIYKQLGDWVNKGDKIGRIDNADAKNQLKQAEAALMAGEASLESATINFESAEKLYKKEMISDSEFLQAKSTLKNAQAGYDGAQASLAMARKNLENSEFTSPVSGFIAELNLEVGEMVSSGRQIAGIVNSQKLLLKTGISETDIPYVKKGDQVTITYHNKDYEGKVSGVGIRPKTGGNNYPVEIELSNKNMQLFPGMVVEGRIFSKTYKNVLYTSIENLREKYDQQFVYVINDENRAEHRIVELGDKISNYVIIKSGLKPGDKLVIDGIDSLTENALVDIRNGFGN
ncbi:MAG: efflux RND transporter periplasmic adaptor subunit [Candidatus Cloacimonadota bacterium]|nr:efflux RND transporter periplasmic adaptor subunit [Candidatus Cloacimonadota bacterium]